MLDGGQVGNDAAHADGRIDARDAPRGGGGFGQGFGGVGFLEQPLAMQVAGLDVIAVDDGEAAHSGAGQGGGMETAQRAAADNGGVRAEKRFLPAFADPREQDLPRIALQAFGGGPSVPMVTKLPVKALTLS